MSSECGVSVNGQVNDRKICIKNNN
jgi:hypothetical protein